MLSFRFVLREECAGLSNSATMKVRGFSDSCLAHFSAKQLNQLEVLRATLYRLQAASKQIPTTLSLDADLRGRQK